MRVQPAITLLSALLMLLIAPDLRGQLVNIEKSRKEAKPGFQGHVDFNLMLTRNTRQIFEAGSSTYVQYTREKHTALLLNSIGFMRVEGDNLINNGFQHLRYNYSIGRGFTTAEVFAQHQYNSIRLLKRRFLTGAGPRFRVFESATTGIYLAPLVMYEQELLNDEESNRTDKIKGSFYVSFTFASNERVNFSHTTYYQPDLSVFSEYRLSSDTGFEVKLDERFYLLLTFNLAYDSAPPADIPELFYTLRNGIRFDF